MATQPVKTDVGAKEPVEPVRVFSDAPVDISEVRNKITRIVGNSAIGIIEKTIIASENGQYLAMKYLFEMAGLHPANATEEAEAEDSLSAILLRSLGIQEGMSPEGASLQTKVSRDSHAEADEGDSPVVK